jgi:hypothetical protein
MKKLFLFLAIVVAVFIPFAVSHAQLSAGIKTLNDANQTTGLATNGDLGTTVGTIIKFVLSLVGTIFLVLMIYAGILWMTARGAEEQITTSKNIIRAAIIGLAITLSAYAITVFVGSRLTGAGGDSTAAGTVQTAQCVDYSNKVSCDTQGQGKCEWIEAMSLCDSLKK